jgi:hypothetical protein
MVPAMRGSITRRTVLGSVGAATMFPEWAAAMHSPVPQVPRPVLEISLRIGEPRPGGHGWRRAQVLTGLATGSLLQGAVQAGTLEWLVDPASGAVQVAADMLLVRRDGAMVRLRDRSAHAQLASCGVPGVPTAPELFDAAGIALPASGQLAGWLDTAAIGRGLLRLRAFAME